MVLCVGVPEPCAHVYMQETVRRTQRPAECTLAGSGSGSPPGSTSSQVPTSGRALPSKLVQVEDPQAQTSSPCGSLAGWQRVVQLYAGHWDAVSVVALPAGTPSTTLAAVHTSVLCGSPLVVNAYGGEVRVGGAPCPHGWVQHGAPGPCSAPRPQDGTAGTPVVSASAQVPVAVTAV